MFRKRKSPSPDFRMPPPYDPVVGRDHWLSSSKPIARFYLDETLTTADRLGYGYITDQWGPGAMHSYSNKIVLENALTKYEGVYAWSGLADDWGLCAWHQGNTWVILMMDQGDIGACLAENHPGRGQLFTIHLGVWSPDLYKWIYDTENTFFAIDWRYDVPYPGAGATGLFSPRPSTTHGVIYECVSLDCASPGACNEA